MSHSKPEPPLTASDLGAFLGSNSDFAFEMKVLARLNALGFECSHSGSYVDPVTEKIRQFDIRAQKAHEGFMLALAVECKNLRPQNPLLLSAIPRNKAEAFHELINYNVGNFSYPSTIRMDSLKSIYRAGEHVAKKTDQVSRGRGSDYVSDDKSTFEKMNQAVNSCRDIVKSLIDRHTQPLIRAVVPIVVVPEGALWQVDYSPDGQTRGEPAQVSRAALFLDHQWSFQHHLVSRVDYRISHIEFVTIESLSRAVDLYLGPEGFFRAGSLRR